MDGSLERSAENNTRRHLRSTEPQLFGRLPAPNTAPGPRMGGTCMNILVPTGPTAPPASDSERRAWSVPDKLYIDWLRTEFEQLMDRAEYDDSLIGNQVKSHSDLDYLRFAMFEILLPTWPKVIKLVTQNLWQTGEARTPIHAFQLFRARPNNDESRAQFLRRFYAAYGTIPPIEQCSDESDSLISWVLQHHTPIEWERLCARSLAYPLNSAIRNAWKIADQVQKEFASNQRFSGDIQAIPRMDNDILQVADRQAVFNNLDSSYARIPDNPINSVNAATNVCYKCRKPGHWAANYHLAPNTNNEFVKPSLKTPLSNSLISGIFQGKISQPVAHNNKSCKTRGVDRCYGRGNSVKQFQNRRVNAAGEDELNEEDDVLNDQDEPYQLTGSFNPDDDYANSPEIENPNIDENYYTNTIFASQPDDEKTPSE
ncbi:hypothetical protein K3495_g6312 [Podosphaera aphanis]|nr:hypothetical protein K3495_g6312 [Podosphaera aphanis]